MLSGRKETRECGGLNVRKMKTIQSEFLVLTVILDAMYLERPSVPKGLIENYNSNIEVQ